jgi:pseudolysin
MKRAFIFLLLWLSTTSVFAANVLSLSHQTVSALKMFSWTPSLGALMQGDTLKQTAAHVDQHGLLHIRFQQQYRGLNVLGADGVVHTPNVSSTLLQTVIQTPSTSATLSGQIYQGVAADLPANLNGFNVANEAKAIAAAVAAYEATAGKQIKITRKKAVPSIYVEPVTQKAHYVYEVTFFADALQSNTLPARMNFVMDASNFTVYRSVNLMMTENKGTVLAGGYGGNEKMGELDYDGVNANLHYHPFEVTRDSETGVCSFTNKEVTVRSYDTSSIINFPCEAESEQHEGLYWDGALGQVNGGYSPENDALFAGGVIKKLYKEWYGLEALVTESGRPMRLQMIVHKPWDNAAWNGEAMVFGDGVTQFYPLTSVGIAAHEISHGFTEQNSNLYYDFQSGAMNEAFSDMAAKAAEVFAYGQVRDWTIGSEVTKSPLDALRFMDKPSQDCGSNTPGDFCSIDNASQYKQGINVHYSSGVYNRAFYLLATSPGWDVKKAFGVMVDANRNYWTSSTNFEEGACGVLAAAKEAGEDDQAVVAAFKAVGVLTARCAAG